MSSFSKSIIFTLNPWVTLISCAYHLKNKGEGGFTNSVKKAFTWFVSFKSYINATKLQLKPFQLNTMYNGLKYIVIFEIIKINVVPFLKNCDILKVILSLIGFCRERIFAKCKMYL